MHEYTERAILNALKQILLNLPINPNSQVPTGVQESIREINVVLDKLNGKGGAE